MEVFQDYAYYYNTVYRDKDYDGEIEQLLELTGGRMKPGLSVLNFGCGTGRHDISLAKRGFHCDGIDLSENMVKIAMENAKKEDVDIGFSQHDIRSFVTDKKYDMVISLFHVMSYQITNDDIMNTFHAAKRALKSGGMFVFDAWYGPGVLTDKPEVRVKEIDDESRKIIRIAKPVMHYNQNRVEVNYDIMIMEKETKATRILHETHNMRYLFYPEIDFFLGEAGFRIIRHADCNTLKDTDDTSWTCYFVAEVK